MTDQDATDPTGLPPEDESDDQSASPQGSDSTEPPESPEPQEAAGEQGGSSEGGGPDAESAPRAKTPQDEIDDALAAAQAAVASLQGDVSGGGSGGGDAMAEALDSIANEETGRSGRDETPAPFELQALEGKGGDGAGGEIDLLSDVNLNVKIELGRTRMLVEDVLKLGDGAVVELDKLAGDPVDVYVNDRLIAKGEVLVLNDNFCVRINEIVDGNVATEEARKRA